MTSSRWASVIGGLPVVETHMSASYSRSTDPVSIAGFSVMVAVKRPSWAISVIASWASVIEGWRNP